MQLFEMTRSLKITVSLLLKNGVLIQKRISGNIIVMKIVIDTPKRVYCICPGS